MEKTEIRTVGTLYLGGQQHGFRPGSVVPIPTAHVEDLRAAKHVEVLEPAPPETAAPDYPGG